MKESVNSKELARRIRIHALNMTHKGKSSHIGSVLSISDLLAVIYSEMKLYPKDPKNSNRDRFILSKGHAGAGVYAVLAEKGFIDLDVLDSHYQDGSILSGHISHKGIPGVELSTGSLGHGLSVGCGMALAAQLKDKNHRVFVMLSDGELDEGSNWESILFASHKVLKNLTLILDYNKLQSLTSIKNTLALEPLVDKVKAFGWSNREVDGHDHQQILKAIKEKVNKPKFIIAHTTKGKGVSFMEDEVLWHYRSPTEEDLEKALKELGV